MNFFALSGLLIGLSCVFMAVLVYSKNQFNIVNKLWSFFCLCVAFWGFSSLAIGLIRDAALALILWRIAYVSVIFIPGIFYHFVLVYLGLRQRRGLIAAYAVSIIFLITDATSLLIPSVARMFGPFYYVSSPGIVYPYFVSFFVLMVIGSHIDLWRFMKHSQNNLRRTQVKWFFMASVVGFVGGITCFIPVFGVNIYPYGNFTVPFYPVIMTYAIVKHQLMDIEVIIQRTAVFAGLFAVVYGTFTVFMMIGQGLFKNVFGWNQWIAMIPTITVIIFALKPLENFLIEKTDKFLFQKKYDYKKVLRSFIDEIVTVLRLEEIVDKTIELLDQTLHPETATFFIFNKSDGSFSIYRAKGYEDDRLKLDKDSKIAWFFKTQKQILSIQENPGSAKVADGVSLEMKSLKAQLAVPLILQSDLIGVMTLGTKKSGEDYSQEELDILTDLAKTEAIAIKNARNIEEIHAANAAVQHAKTMQQVADMADGISHQFNNRFNAISVPLGLLKILIRKMTASLDGLNREDQLKKIKETFAQASDIVGKAADNAVRGGDIAKGLLKYSRPDKAGFEMQDVAKVINLSLEMLGYKHDDLNQIEIQKDFPPGVPMTWANVSYLQDIYFIILDNAYDAIHQKRDSNPDHKGRIAIRLTYQAPKEIIQVVFEDNGIGMKPEILEKVKAAVPYVTTKASSSQKSGYGSGVQVLNRLVNLHEGKIDYESVYGEGTRTILELPVKKNPED